MNGITEDRLAIIFSSPTNFDKQFAASPVIPDGTGASQAQVLWQVTGEWGVQNYIVGQVFDTTASNTGRHKGAATRLESLLGKPFLWLACRHHVGELHVFWLYSVCRGADVPKAPENALFKRFHTAWPRLNPNVRVVWTWPVNANDWRYLRANCVLLWARNMMLNGTFRRGDHREFLELAVIYLGGAVLRPRAGRPPVAGFRMRKPGSTNQTRFMGIGLHEFKIAMMQGQFGQTVVGRRQSQALAEYLALIHAPYFLQARLAIAAPRLDCDLWIDLHVYKRLYPVGSLQARMVDASLLSISRHTRYLTEELVIFALWDDQLAVNERKAMARKVLQKAPPANNNWQTKKPDLPNLPDRPRLRNLIGCRSWLLFRLLNLGTAWLDRPVREWMQDPEYRRAKDFLSDLKVVNDAAERCNKDVTEYADMARDSAHRENILLVVNDHRGVFQELRREALARMNP